MGTKYRYITNGAAKPSDMICHYRLIGGRNMLSAQSCIRVKVNDVELEKWSCDPYSTTEDKRTLEKLGCDIMVRINWKLTVRNDLKRGPDAPSISEQMHALGYRPAMRENRGCVQYTYLDKKHAKAHYDELDRLAKEQHEKELAECGGDIMELCRRHREKARDPMPDGPMIKV